ncbi:DUF4111 domain-containing protein [Paenibacillus sp. sptzw28]|uniref:aminoglycoside adenylyltransferase domain-containing protein n=1 Tax=Paenibacillus sp. sptzw28 TaxID=715179 RepID=UPI001C6E0994|nr:aminoglycoside adenylyltransferase domain-containing protein [Paenibacillus sp. sptzw28]QYR19603.1 DUF4111 domain-containing protein [Paenibacillus sp. sptzw28]
MSGYDWHSCPAEIKTQAANIKEYLINVLDENLIGIYIHGSMCLGCFQPSHSDLDILVVIHNKLDAFQRFKLMQGFLALHKQPIPIELSILTHSEITPWVHPTPYQFHFSEYWREKLEVIDAEHNLDFWDYKQVYTDGDLACHVTLTNQSGICIFGPEINKVFPKVPPEDFWDSIVWGVDYFINLEGELLVTGILSLIRIWSYKENEEIYSKAQAGEWAMNLVPPQYQYIVRNATDAYNAEQKVKQYKPADLEGLKQFVIEKIKESSSSPENNK